MKVLHILDSLNRGGAEVLLLDICRASKRSGLDLHFMATGGGTLEEDFKCSGVEYFRLQRQLPFDPRLAAQMRTIIKKEKYDIIHNYQAVAGLHTYFAAMGLPAKQILSYQGFFGDVKNRLVTRFLAPRMAMNISCSNGLLQWLAMEEKIDTEEFAVVPNAADRERLIPTGKNLREELGLSADTVIFGMMAHFYTDPRKDHRTVCHAFAQVSQHIPDSCLVLAGRTEPGAEAKMEECVEICREAGILDQVYFLGFRQDAADIATLFDVHVLSSLHEGFPVALVEAMLLGKACVLSDIPPHIEASVGGKYAELFTTGNAEQLAEKMLFLGSDSSKRQSLGEAAYKYATDNLSIEAHIESLKNIYRSVSE